ncbi:kinesin family protein, partial [Moniliophthora roreri]
EIPVLVSCSPLKTGAILDIRGSFPNSNADELFFGHKTLSIPLADDVRLCTYLRVNFNILGAAEAGRNCLDNAPCNLFLPATGWVRRRNSITSPLHSAEKSYSRKASTRSIQ